MARKTASPAMAAGFALSWKESGRFFQTMRSLSLPYCCFSWSMVGSTLAQKGHWNSEKTTIVTGAVREPQVGSLSETGMAASESLHLAPPWAVADESLEMPPSLWSRPYMSPMPAPKESRKPTIEVPFFMMMECP